ncbi:hypothetical protein NX059_003726 [Plenodomus lindquistii]|nr:hypothetical protein NX059_003726 [Plenodomus lindquistii]
MKKRREGVKFGKTKDNGFQLHQALAIQDTVQTKKVDFIWDGLYAAWTIVNEIHLAGGPDTITYKQVIEPFRKLTKPKNWSSVTAITGSALANSISTMITFACKALVQQDKN